VYGQLAGVGLRTAVEFVGVVAAVISPVAHSLAGDARARGVEGAVELTGRTHVRCNQHDLLLTLYMHDVTDRAAAPVLSILILTCCEY